MKLSIVSIHYQSNELMNSLITSFINDNTNYELEFIIIDNSSDFSYKGSLPITMICPGYNSGFARGVNAGLKNATGDLILVVNQDAFLFEKNTLNQLVDNYLKLPEKTIMSCKLVDENEQYQQSIWLDNPGIKRIWKFGALHYKLFPKWKEHFDQETKQKHNFSGYVPRFNGAFFILKNDHNLKEAFFDEDFFLYGEDVEWALRLKKKKWKFYYFSNVRIKHLGSASSNDNEIKQLQIIVSDWLAIRKLYGKNYLRLLILLLKFNYFVDKMLRAYYLRRKGTLPLEYDDYTRTKDKILKTALSKYKTVLLSEKKLSSDNKFKLNCYE